MKHALCLVIAVVVSVACAQDESGKNELEKWSSEFSAAWEKNDAQALTDRFVEEGDLIDPFGVRVRGRDEIGKFVKELHDTVMKGSKYDIQTVEVRLIKPDVAIVDWDVMLTGIKSKSDGPSSLKHHVTWVMQKRDGKWQAVASRPAAALPPPGKAEAAKKAD